MRACAIDVQISQSLLKQPINSRGGLARKRSEEEEARWPLCCHFFHVDKRRRRQSESLAAQAGGLTVNEIFVVIAARKRGETPLVDRVAATAKSDQTAANLAFDR